MSNRDITIDILRFIALSGIILIHIGPNNFLSQLRSFDVPLMVFLSGISYYISTSLNPNASFKKYYIKRFKRLVLPVWFYLPIYFLLHVIVSKQPPTVFQIISYYSLITFWYVWIIRVFFIIALFAPLVTSGLNQISNRTFYVYLGSAFILFEYIIEQKYFTSFLSTIILTNIPYILIFSIGYKLLKLPTKQIIVLGSIFLFAYITYAVYYYTVNNEYILTSKYKYPPQLYYTSYALAACILLWLIRNQIVIFLKKLPIQFTQLFCFIGTHSMWIYLWHILLVEYFRNQFSATIRYILVYSIATGIVYLQNLIVKDFICKRIRNDHLIKNIKIVFIG